MEDLVKVYLFRGEMKLDDVEIKRCDFENALDALFGDDEERVTVLVGNQEIADVTDIILAAVSEEATVEEGEFHLAA